MAIITIKRGDTYRLIRMRAAARAGNTLPSVTGSTAVMIVRDYDTDDAGALMSGSVTVAASGDDVLVTYNWATGDTDAVADWDVEFEVTLSDGTIWTIPGSDRRGRPVYQRVMITQDLGDATTSPTATFSGAFGDQFGAWIS